MSGAIARLPILKVYLLLNKNDNLIKLTGDMMLTSVASFDLMNLLRCIPLLLEEL